MLRPLTERVPLGTPRQGFVLARPTSNDLGEWASLLFAVSLVTRERSNQRSINRFTAHNVTVHERTISLGMLNLNVAEWASPGHR
jgi:hypothetical protein